MSTMKRKAYWAAKKAWFQGQKEKSMEGAITSNDPEKLGYPKEIGYEKGPMAVTAPGGEDSRPWEDKWFNDAAAVTKTFMGPAGEEFKEKQHWLRIPADEKVINANTKLTAKFSAVAKDPKASYWTFFVDGKPVIASTLGKIWGKGLNEVTAKETATKEYAKAVMSKMRTEGLPKVAWLLTGAKLEKTAESTKDGKKTAWYKEEMDVEDALDNEAEMTGNELDAAENVAEQKLEEIESLEEQIVEKIAPEGQAVEVFKGLQEAEEALEQTASELKSIRVKLASGNLSAANKIKIIKLAEGAIADAVTTFEASDDAMQDGQDLIPDGGAEEGMMEEPMADGGEVSEEEAVKMANEAIQAAESFVAEGGEEHMDEMPAEEVETKEDIAGEPVAEQTTTISKATVRKFVEGRKAKRNAIAEMKEEKKYEVVPDGGPKDGHAEIERAHPDGTHFVSDLTAGGTPKEKLDGFVTGIEAQENDVAIAEKTPKGNYTGAAKTKVKTAATETEHPVTPDTKSYWISYFAEMGPEGKKFGQELVADHTDKSGEEIGKAAKAVIEKQVNSALEIQKGKLRRANELAELASTKGMVAPTVEAKLELVDSIMDFDDKAFASYKKAVESAPTKRVIASEELGIRTASAKALKIGQIQESEMVSTEGNDEYSNLARIGWK